MNKFSLIKMKLLEVLKNQQTCDYLITGIRVKIKQFENELKPLNLVVNKQHKRNNSYSIYVAIFNYWLATDNIYLKKIMSWLQNFVKKMDFLLNSLMLIQ